MIQRTTGAVLPLRTKAPPATAESEVTRALVSIAESLREILQVIRAERPVKAAIQGERQAIAWLLEYVQTAEFLPAMSEISRLAGIPRRQLTKDRWPRFYDTYHRIRGLQDGVDKSRMVDHFEDEHDDN